MDNESYNGSMYSNLLYYSTVLQYFIHHSLIRFTCTATLATLPHPTCDSWKADCGTDVGRVAPENARECRVCIVLLHCFQFFTSRHAHDRRAPKRILDSNQAMCYVSCLCRIPFICHFATSKTANPLFEGATTTTSRTTVPGSMVWVREYISGVPRRHHRWRQLNI